MDDRRLGIAIRAVRRRRRWRQIDLASASGISRSAISRLERGNVGGMRIDDVRAVAAAMEMRVRLTAWWRAGDLDRLLNAAHSQLHEQVARWFRDRYPAWVLTPEVTFAFYADRGVVDILAWHPGRRALLVVELKTEIVDVNELLGTLHRKRRVAPKVAAERSWEPVAIGAWLIVAETRSNRRRVETHTAMLRNALPDDATAMRHWIRDPVGPIGAISFWSEATTRCHRGATIGG